LIASRKLPSGFADPTEFGDLFSLALAYIAFVGLQRPSAEKPLLFPCGSPALSARLGCITPTVYVLLLARLYA